MQLQLEAFAVGMVVFTKGGDLCLSDKGILAQNL